jgi:hypothetical protein
MTPRRSLSVPVLLTSFIVGAGCGRKSPVQPTPDCSASLTVDRGTFDPAGGTGTATLAIGSGCVWAAASSAGWITLIGDTTGRGAAAIPFTVVATTAEADRTGTITAAGESVSILQHGTPAPATCTYDVSPDMAAFPSRGGTGSVQIATTADCAWTAESSVDWVVLTSSRQGTGTATIAYTVAASSQAQGRAGTLTVGGRTVTISQDGDTAACSYSIATVDFSPCVGATELSAMLTTQPGCPWTASPTVDWISMLSGTSGLGSVLIRFAVAGNYAPPRSGTVEVRWPTPTAGQNLHVNQAGCRYGVSRTAIAAPAGGGSFNFDVLQETEPNTCGGPLQNACVWSASSDAPWVVLSSTNQHTGDGRVNFTVQANPGSSPRSATITVRDQHVHVMQAGS